MSTLPVHNWLAGSFYHAGFDVASCICSSVPEGSQLTSYLRCRFEQAEYIERELERMGENIRETIQNVNASQVVEAQISTHWFGGMSRQYQVFDLVMSVYQGGDLDAVDGASPLDLVVRILNNQLSSLVWIDEQAREARKFSSLGPVVSLSTLGLLVLFCFRRQISSTTAHRSLWTKVGALLTGESLHCFGGHKSVSVFTPLPCVHWTSQMQR